MTELVTVGETMLRLSVPPGERLARANRLDVHVGGAESNVAVTAAGLGVDSVWVSKVADSPLGHRVTTELRGRGVEPRVTWSDEGRQGLYFLERGRSPRESTVIYDRDGSPIRTATPEDLFRDRVAAADAVHTTGITLALSDALASTVEELLSVADTACFDLNYRSKLWSIDAAREGYETVFPHVDVLFAPARDARRILETDGDPAAIGVALRDRYDLDIAVITAGQDGAVAVAADETVTQPAIDADTVDAIGTGDAFAGGFLATHFRGGTLQEALATGAGAAAIKRTIEGDAATITEAEVAMTLDSSPGGIDR